MSPMLISVLDNLCNYFSKRADQTISQVEKTLYTQSSPVQAIGIVGQMKKSKKYWWHFKNKHVVPPQKRRYLQIAQPAQLADQ